ncbi:TniQ family protein [Actinoplanes hulinensis]|uniref:TniQ family protein n=1 Tax=Actinoplanes hulinensis TaxID=1144547 RepID=A0ABS7B3Q6_9ACTN|nr:TniQ family protein [Actinoplanes hulinensis]MBW6434933.1 TniQ family protein [Actinoplanes hulinensis]
MQIPRTLPLRADPAPGEALDSWLMRLAHRNGMPLRWLTTALGFGDRLWVWHNYDLTWKLPPSLLRRIEAQAGLPSTALDATVLDQFNDLGWKPLVGSRFCPGCLNESAGRWPIRWQLPYTFACLIHRSLLAVLCPTCQRVPRNSISERSGIAPPTHCTHGRTRHGPACDSDLLSHPMQPLDPADPRLTAQIWINIRLDRFDDAAVTDLRDLNALAVWFLHRIDPNELEYLGSATVSALNAHRDGLHGIKRHSPTAAVIAAAMACQAIDVITADEGQRLPRITPLLRDVYTTYRTGQAPAARGPMILSHQRLSGLSEHLRHSILTSADGHLPVSERLRYRTCTTTPRLPEPDSGTAADRARHLPQYLWPDWLIRFLPTRGAHVTEVAIDITNALLIPGNPVRNLRATDELTPWRNATSLFLSDCAKQHPDTLAAICALAEHLDAHGSPIDYRRRRSVFTDIALTAEQWHEICYQASSDPGRADRLLNARRYLFQLLTGADLNNPQHLLAFTSKSSKAGLQNFHRLLNSPLREGLHRHGIGLLHAAGIDEPLTWSPPATCVAGLILPGRDPDDIDLSTAQHLLDVENLSPTAVARRLGVTVEHIRYIQHRFDRPPPTLPKTSPTAARQLRERATAVLTRAFFNREYRQAGRTLRNIATTTGIAYTLVAQHARAHGFPVSNRSKKEAATHARRVTNKKRPRVTPKRKREARKRKPIIDPAWLQQQAGTLQRTNGDIAAELALSHQTVRRHRQHLGIAARPTGSAGHVVQTRRHPELPADLRRAVEGKRNGWQRLRRFQNLAAHPSVNAAAKALGLHTQNLSHQLDQLEADIGQPLIERTSSRYRAMQLTQAGRDLLEQLRRPSIRRLLDRYAPPHKSWKENKTAKSDAELTSRSVSPNQTEDRTSHSPSPRRRSSERMSADDDLSPAIGMEKRS